MRFFAALLVVLALVIPTWAQAECNQVVPCPGDPGSSNVSSAGLAAIGNACITENFGYTNSSGFFDVIAGLDGDGCLTSIANSVPKGIGSQVIPVCCATKIPAGVCKFRCRMDMGH